MRKPCLIAAALALAPSVPAAAAQNVVPSCYDRIKPGVAAPPIARETFILVDQTTALDPALVRTLRENVARLVRPGTAFTVATFSAFEPGHYAEVVAAGRVEGPVPAAKRNAISVPKLKKLDACLRSQTVYGARAALAAVDRARASPAESFSRSEIMASLKQLSARVAQSPARDKIVLVASDMLEHSSATSFYARQGLRQIAPAAEMKKAATHKLGANFGGARVYVLGAGLLPPQSREAGRTIAALNALEAFWTGWFRGSNAKLVAFGKPNLVNPVR